MPAANRFRLFRKARRRSASVSHKSEFRKRGHNRKTGNSKSVIRLAPDGPASGVTCCVVAYMRPFVVWDQGRDNGLTAS